MADIEVVEALATELPIIDTDEHKPQDLKENKLAVSTIKFGDANNNDKKEQDVPETNEVIEEPKDNPPPDKFFMIHGLFFFLGLMHFIPSSFFSTATKYWMYKFRNNTLDHDDPDARTILQKEFSVYSTIFSSTPMIIFMTLTTIYGQRVNARIRIIWSILVILIAFSISTCLIKVNTDDWQLNFFILTMFFVFLKSAANSVLGVSLFEILSKFPRKFLVWYLTGEGIAGPFNDVLQLMSLACATNEEDSALIYFTCGVLVMFVTLLLFIFTKYTALYKYYIGKSDTVPRKKVLSWTESKVILKKIWSSIVIFVVMISGLQLISPAITTLIVSEQPGTPWGDNYFIPFTYLLRDISDLIGRTFASKVTLHLHPIIVSVIGVIRMAIVIPMYIFSNARPRRPDLPVLLKHDYQYCILVTCYGLTGGYLFNVAFLNIRRLVSEDQVNDAYNVLATSIGIIGAVSSGFSYLSVNKLIG